MALQKSYTDRFGQTHTEAYHHISLISITNHPHVLVPTVNIRVAIYADAQARTDHRETYEYRNYEITGDDFDTYFAASVMDQPDCNFTKQGYLYLKTETADYNSDTTDV